MTDTRTTTIQLSCKALRVYNMNIKSLNLYRKIHDPTVELPTIESSLVNCERNRINIRSLYSAEN